jgi:hypothetical protein
MQYSQYWSNYGDEYVEPEEYRNCGYYGWDESDEGGYNDFEVVANLLRGYGSVSEFDGDEIDDGSKVIDGGVVYDAADWEEENERNRQLVLQMLGRGRTADQVVPEEKAQGALYGSGMYCEPQNEESWKQYDPEDAYYYEEAGEMWDDGYNGRMLFLDDWYQVDVDGNMLRAMPGDGASQSVVCPMSQEEVCATSNKSLLVSVCKMVVSSMPIESGASILLNSLGCVKLCEYGSYLVNDAIVVDEQCGILVRSDENMSTEVSEVLVQGGLMALHDIQRCECLECGVCCDQVELFDYTTDRRGGMCCSVSSGHHVRVIHSSQGGGTGPGPPMYLFPVCTPKKKSIM